MHPDQLSPLWPAANLPLQVVFSLGSETGHAEVRGQVRGQGERGKGLDSHHASHVNQKTKRCEGLTRARSRLRLCSWKAAGLFSAGEREGGGERERERDRKKERERKRVRGWGRKRDRERESERKRERDRQKEREREKERGVE